MTQSAQRPTVDVVMCTYNGAKFLRPQLDSILSQTYPIASVIIQDDCSTDSTADIIRQYQSRYSNIRFYPNSHNLGFNRNFREAAMRSTADFVAFSDQDDVWFPTKIEHQLQAIGEHNICYSWHTRGSDPARTHIVKPQSSPEALLFGGFAGHTMLLRGDFVRRPESWIDNIYYDWSLGVNAWFYQQRGIVLVPEPLNWHRSHEGEAALLQNRRLFPESGKHPAWKPYTNGLANYRRLQSKPQWQHFYGIIAERSAGVPACRKQHRMAMLMLDRSPLALLRLCMATMKLGSRVYPDPDKVHGMMGTVRSFCYPLIFAYRNSLFDF